MQGNGMPAASLAEGKSLVIAKGKVYETDGKLTANRVETTLKLVSLRVGLGGQTEQKQEVIGDKSKAKAKSKKILDDEKEKEEKEKLIQQRAEKWKQECKQAAELREKQRQSLAWPLRA